MEKDMAVLDVTKTCVFLKLTLSRLGDKRGLSSDQIEVDANKDLVKARKIIFRSQRFDAIKSLDSEIRRYVRGVCLPFDSGIHMVPLGMVSQINHQLNLYLQRRLEMVDLFAEIWPELISEAKPELRSIFSEGDYVHGVKDSFEMGWQFLAFTAPLEMESVDPELLRSEQLKFQARMREAWEEARYVMRETCLELVSHLRGQLEPDQFGAPKRLSTSTITHLWDFLKSEPLRNITGDQELSQYSETMRGLLEGVDREALKSADGLRDRIRTELGQIETSLEASISTSPRRRIKVATDGTI